MWTKFIVIAQTWMSVPRERLAVNMNASTLSVVSSVPAERDTNSVMMEGTVTVFF